MTAGRTHRRAVQAAGPLTDVLENTWQTQVVELARRLGYHVYHTYNSRRSAHGFPDLVLVRDQIVYLELKRETGKATDDQKRWLRALRDAGAHAYIARPRDLQHVAELLARRSPTGESNSSLRASTDIEIGD